ncbi:uncharacterized protein LOC123467775 [Daphnia magna]|uniref:uncharacterized protein LOC123467775 n=1 Tax=Daphnia magna TaxID=35525 RepID=UPI001E1BA9EF|nr:uncharacterized protein LOC123467775 [Daphnia magna]
MYNTAKQMQESEITYPARSTPSLRKVLDAMNTIDIQPWPEKPQLPSSYNYPPPSNPAICKTLWFPMSKKKAMDCRIETVNLFNSLSHKIPDTTICAYTDGSHEPSKNITTCAVYIPRLNVTKSWTLSKHSSIFSAELQAIYQTLRIIYDLTDNPPEVLVYCDSSSAIKTIVSNQQSTNEAISLIRETIRSLKSSGTRTTLAWIPSHTGITGNERADALANMESKTPSGERTENPLSPSEKASVARKTWANAHLMEIKRCQKVCIQMKTTLNLTRWHYHKERAVSICLHRLRSGHNYTNAFNHRIDHEADPSCRQGCEALEDVKHILIDCPAFDLHRHKLRQLLATKNLNFDTHTILGMNPLADPATQYKIRDLLGRFLIQTALIHII